MRDYRKFYINGEWVPPTSPRDFEVENPATETPVAVISLGTSADVDKAVAAAKAAFPAYAATSRGERLALLENLHEIYMERYEEMAEAISLEMGAPISFAKAAQADCGKGHLEAGIEALRSFEFSRELSHGAMLVREPIGVCAMITPWNWPINQIACKVVPALATGCTMVLKPSEVAPLSGHLWSEMIDQAGFPAGVYNMINGDGPGVGAPLSAHPDVDMVSFTGSTRAGSAISKAGAEDVKRIALELGGKSPNVILDDADLQKAVSQGVFRMMSNTGQSCNAPSRMLVPESRYEEAVEIAARACAKVQVGDPAEEGGHIGPLSSKMQFDKVQGLIQKGIEEGARLVCGGPGRPEGFNKGWFAKPTIFADVNNGMTIAREEIFGPVLVMIPYRDDAEAIEIANDTPYGLAGYVQSDNLDHARAVAARIRAGMIHLNGAGQNYDAPFGGYKRSGNGREWGEYGFEDFLETKVVNGYGS